MLLEDDYVDRSQDFVDYKKESKPESSGENASFVNAKATKFMIVLKLKLAILFFSVWAIFFIGSWSIIIPNLTLSYIVPPTFFAVLMTLINLMNIRIQNDSETVTGVLIAYKGKIILFVFLYLVLLGFIYLVLLLILGNLPFNIKIALWFAPLITVYLWSALNR